MSMVKLNEKISIFNSLNAKKIMIVIYYHTTYYKLLFLTMGK
jgi:hypothetical protein